MPGMDWTQEEFSAAVTEHSRSMYRAARAVLDSAADAEDAVGGAALAHPDRAELRLRPAAEGVAGGLPGRPAPGARRPGTGPF